MIRPVVKVELAKKLADVGSLTTAIDGLPFSGAILLAKAAWQRVGREGRPVRPFHGYNSGKRGKAVSSRYPLQGGRISEKTGARVFRDSRELHAGVRPGSFWVTGGMWSGLSVVVVNAQISRVAFRGRSEGQGMAMGQSRNEPYFDAAGKQHPKKVSNALKAATVLRATKVHILEPTAEELSRLLSQSVAVLAEGLREALVADVVWQTKAKGALAVALHRTGITSSASSRVVAGGGLAW